MNICKNIPPPSGTPLRYPFEDMNVGDSVLVPSAQAASARNGAVYHAKRLGRKFVSRKVPTGVRIWRVQ